MVTHTVLDIHPITTKDKVQHNPMPLHLIVPIKTITSRRIILNLYSINEKTLPLNKTTYQQTAYQVQLILLTQDKKSI